MPGIAVRDFECELCRQNFSRETGDFIAPGDAICDKCLAAIVHLDGDDLAEFVSRQLTTNYPQYDEHRRNNVLQNVQWFKNSLPSNT